MLRIFGLAVGLALVGCGGSESPSGAAAQAQCPSANDAAGANSTAPVCEPGRIAECPCTNGGKGMQTCSSDGAEWGACQCEGVKPPPPQLPPADGCPGGPLVGLKLEPGMLCPSNKPVIYVSCPSEYIDSGLCSFNQDSTFTCCPT